MRSLGLWGLLLLAGCSAPRESFKGVELRTLGSEQKRSVAECPATKCLTIYIAPWCPYCRAGTPMMLALRGYLEKKGVPTRFVVGLDNPGAVTEYAKSFGPDTFLDPNGRLAPKAGVPSFRVTDARGTVWRSQSGVPGEAVKPPFDDGLLGQIAYLYGLP